jgi:hypothetical protein
LERLTLSSCHDTLQVIVLEECTLAPGTLPAVHILATSTSGGTVTLGSPRVRCFIAGSGGASFCEYTMTSPAGTATNSPSSITFSSVNIERVTGSPGDQGVLCGANATFGVTLTHIVQSSTNRTVTISTS